MNHAQKSPAGARGASLPLALAALIAALCALGLAVSNYRGLGQVAQSGDLHRSVARQIAADADLRAELAASAEIRAAIGERLHAQVTSDAALQSAITQEVANSPELVALVEQTSAAAVSRSQSGDAFRSAVLAAVAETQASGEPALPVIDDMQQALRRYEAQLSALATEVRDDESAAAVNAMQGQLAQLQQNIDALSSRVSCTVRLQRGGPRTFLLRSNDSTELPGYDLVISLSRLRGDVVDTVSISAAEGDSTAAGQVNTKVIGNVALGTPFEFVRGDTSFQGMFTFAQNRLFSRALIGFEIRTLIPEGEAC